MRQKYLAYVTIFEDADSSIQVGLTDVLTGYDIAGGR